MLKRNCALSPRQLALFYASLVAVSFLIGIGFALMGAWLVLPFAGAEMVALGVALLHYGRHVGDRDVVVLEREALRVELVRAGVVYTQRFDPYWVRVEVDGTPALAVWLREGWRVLRLGRFVSDDQRAVFAKELQGALARQRLVGAGATVGSSAT